MPRYNKTWDVNVILKYLRGMGKVTELSIKELTLKLVMLIVLTTACSRLEEVNGVVFLSHLLNKFTAQLSSSFFQAAKVGNIKGI